MTHFTILAAIGQLPQDVAVLHRALEISTASRSDLHIVHVLDLPGDIADLTDITTFLGQAAFAARDVIAGAIAELGTDPSDVQIHIELGSHAFRLIEVCNEISPDLIVMRTHQRVKITERLLGSTTDRVIGATQIPVLVVKRPVERRYGGVMLATNGSDDAVNASRFISALLPENRLHVVQVVQIPPQLKEAMLRAGSQTADLAAYLRNLVKNAHDHLKDLTEKCGRSVTSEVLKGDPAKTLTRLCRNQDFDLIALGQGRSSLIRRAFIGSVSRHLLRDAACDVLIWNPKPVGAAT
ncbi:universal stress protein [Aliiroseovarius sp. S1339]|uniref:universal stress protein n=1 Tax=Aliiroseovarius sp. S1339 TaxID=2936990 RepID=UPI0020C16667|nr:universal stress protein [Aliiroseovarius sp. S1339]MCK8462902.1 universal stress protein [Aliiroseovarius sp. S1339]